MGKLGYIYLVLGCSIIFSIAEAEEIRYDKGARRDPFVAPMDVEAMRAGSTGHDALSVEGIVFDPKGSSYAVIGGEIYREGESVQGSKILRILPDRVIFFQENEEIVIWLRQEIVNRNEK